MAKEERELYLKQLCSTVGFPWEQLPVDRFAQMHEHAEINKLFFSLEVPRPVIRLNPNQVCSLKQMEFRKTHLEDLKRSLGDAKATWHQRVKDANFSLQKVMDLQREIDERAAYNPPSVLDAVEAVHKEGKWKCVRVSRVDGSVEFIQLTDTILTWKDPAKMVNQQVNLGRFRVRLKLNGAVTIHPFSNNVEADGYYHPHIRGDGWVCWGNAADEVARAFRTNDFTRILGILQVFLQEYNDGPGGPYTGIMRFIAERGKKYDAGRVLLGAFWFPKSTTDAIGVPFRAQDRATQLVRTPGDVEAFQVNIYASDDGDPCIKTTNDTFAALNSDVTWYDTHLEALAAEKKIRFPETNPQQEIAF